MAELYLILNSVCKDVCVSCVNGCERHIGVDVLSFGSTVRRERSKGFVNKKRILKLVQALRYVLHGGDNITFFLLISLIKHRDMVGSFMQLVNLAVM